MEQTIPIIEGRQRYLFRAQTSITEHVLQTLPFPWHGRSQNRLQLLIQPWVCAPRTHYNWIDWGSEEYKVCPTPCTQDQHWVSNPKYYDHESYAMFITFSSYDLRHTCFLREHSAEAWWALNLCTAPCLLSSSLLTARPMPVYTTNGFIATTINLWSVKFLKIHWVDLWQKL